MASKTVSSAVTSRGYTLSLIMTEASQSIENNKTTIDWELRLYAGNTYYFQSWGIGWEVYINGSRVGYHDRYTSDRYSVSLNSYTTLDSGTTTVTHDTDGTKEIEVEASMDMSSSSPAAGAISLSGDWTLTTIPRASTLTIPTLTIGQSATFTIVSASASFDHKITYSLGSVSGTLTANAGVTTKTWTPPNSLYAQIPNSTSANIAIAISTYSSGNLIGTNSYSVPMNVGVGIVPTAPTVTITPVNTNAWINSQGLYVGGYSRVKIDSSANPGTGASISSYTLSGGVVGTGASVTSAILASGTYSITVTAQDSRGRTNSTTVSVTFLPYSNPTLTTFSAERGTWSGSWASDVNGDHIRVTAIATVSLDNEGNTATITASASGTSPDVTSGNYLIWTSTNSTTTYTITGTVTDSVGKSSSRTISVSTVEVPFNINVDLAGASFGMIAQDADTVEIAPSWKLKVKNVTMPDSSNPDKYLGTDANGDLEYKTLPTPLTIDDIYPVGSIYMSVNNTNPSVLFGGTWTQIKDTFLLSAGDTYTNGDTGGEASHTLTENEMPSHYGHLASTAEMNAMIGTENFGSASGKYLPASAMTTYGTLGRGWNVNFSNEEYPNGLNRGGGQAHNNLPPYLVVFIWKRVT